MENLGNILSFKTPSGFDVTIREQNGEDDEIISKLRNASDGSAINRFISSIVLNCSLYKDDHRVTLEDILKWKNKDKYYSLLRSRMFSLGTEITYKHTCSNPNCSKETNYEEDLKQYDRDFSKGEEGINDFKYQVTPYPNGLELGTELTLSSGKKIRYTYLNGLSEKKLLEYDKNNISKNTELIVRDIQWHNGNQWQKLENFKILSAKEMAQIRQHVSENDLPFEAITETTCPFCGQKDTMSLMAEPDFFFPRGI